MGWREREKERERGREGERERDRQTDRLTDRLTDRHSKQLSTGALHSQVTKYPGLTDNPKVNESELNQQPGGGSLLQEKQTGVRGKLEKGTNTNWMCQVLV